MTSIPVATEADVTALRTYVDAQIAAHGGIQGTTGAAGAPGSQTYSGSTTPSSGLGINGDWYFNTTTWDVSKKVGGSWATQGNIKGAQGIQGAGGANGSTIYSGTGTPSSGTGVNGDWYFDLTSGALKLYGPKASGAWGAGTSIMGTNGTNGTNGATWFSGSGTPSSGTGANGDFYVDLANAAIYGPKTSGAWGSAHPIQTYNFTSQPGSTTTYALTAADNGHAYGFGAGTANNITVTVPNTLPQNFTVDIYLEGSGTLTVQSDATNPATLHARGVASTTLITHPGTYDVVTVFCRFNGSGSQADCFVLNGVT